MLIFRLKTFVAALLVLAPAAIAQEQKPATPAIDPAEREKIEAVMVEYLLEHPEVVMVALREFQRRQMVSQMMPAISLYRDYLENEPGAPVLGNPDGDVTIVEFFDYRCSFCRKHFPAVMQLLKEDSNIRLVPKQYPILDRRGQPPLSFMSARAAMAAHQQGKFAELHIALMSEPNGITSEDQIYVIAQREGLDVARLKEDMRSRLIDKNIQNSLAIGQEIGFTGTPGYIIANDVIVGAEGLYRLQEAVARARGEEPNRGLLTAN